MLQLAAGIIWGFLSAVLVAFGGGFAFVLLKETFRSAFQEKMSALGWGIFLVVLLFGGFTGVFGAFALGVYVINGFAVSEGAQTLAKAGFGLGCLIGFGYGVFYFKFAKRD